MSPTDVEKRRAYAREYAKKNPEKVRAWQKAANARFREKNREKLAADSLARYHSTPFSNQAKQRARARQRRGVSGAGTAFAFRRATRWGERYKAGTVLFTDDHSVLERISFRSDDHVYADPVADSVEVWSLVERFSLGELSPELHSAVAEFLTDEGLYESY